MSDVVSGNFARLSPNLSSIKGVADPREMELLTPTIMKTWTISFNHIVITRTTIMLYCLLQCKHNYLDVFFSFSNTAKINISQLFNSCSDIELQDAHVA